MQRVAQQPMLNTGGTMWMPRRLVILSAVILSAGSAAAGTVCRSVGFAGLEDVSRRAALAVGPLTTDTMAIRFYSERTQLGYYYQSNYSGRGSQYGVKILSETALTDREVVENLLYMTRDEADSEAVATELIVARTLVVNSEAAETRYPVLIAYTPSIGYGPTYAKHQF